MKARRNRKPKDLKFWKQAKQTKYRSVQTFVDGIKFPSKKEAARYSELKLMQISGVISNLRLQVPFDLTVNGQKVCRYVADFCYTENGKEVTEDVKGVVTRIYSLKKKLMKAIHGIEIKEV